MKRYIFLALLHRLTMFLISIAARLYFTIANLSRMTIKAICSIFPKQRSHLSKDVNQSPIPSLPNVYCNLQILLFLDMRNISVSAGSACHSGSDTPSYVLKAMGLTDEEALSTLRFSFNEPLTDRQLKYLIQALKDGILQQLENE